MHDAVQASRLRMDYRPHLGLTEAHRGSLVERVLANVVLDEAIEQHNRDAKRR